MNKKSHAKIIIGICIIPCLIMTPVYAQSKPSKPSETRILIRSLVIEPGIDQCLETATNACLRTVNSPVYFAHESKILSTGDIRVWMNGSAKLEEMGWTILKSDAERVVLPLSDAANILKRNGLVKTVILDPGHGGEDSGARGVNGVQEKELTLDIASRVRKHLIDAGYTVKMTRGIDTYIALDQRTKLAEDWNADLFVSIHLNSAPNPLASGVETFVLPAPELTSTLNGNGSLKERKGNKYDAESIVIASRIHSGILTETRSFDRGIKHARFDVLCEAPCPAILLECGFLSNLKEERRLCFDDFREKISLGISEGIKKCQIQSGE